MGLGYAPVYFAKHRNIRTMAIVKLAYADTALDGSEISSKI